MNGKVTCEALKKVRKQIADANGIPYEPVVCNHKGDCRGTCPACEAEMRYIERELAVRKRKEGHLHIVGVAKDLLPSKEDFAKHAAAVAITAAASLSAVPIDACAQESRPDTVVNVRKMVTIKGVVEDEAGGLPGATVTVKGTAVGVETDDEGNFEIEAPVGSVLVFEFVGCEPKEVPVKKREWKLKVELKYSEDVGIEGALPIVMCGAVSRSSFDSDVQFHFQDYGEGINHKLSVGDAIDGFYAPVYMSTTSGQPGVGKHKDVLGKSSLVGNENLFIVYEGFPAGGSIGRYFQNSFYIPDVKSENLGFDNLFLHKSCNSGVGMYVSMEDGKIGYPTIQYKGSFSVSQFAKRYSMMNLQKYASYKSANMASDADKSSPQENTSLMGSETDWQDELFRTAVGHDHHLSFSSDDHNRRYYSSLGYTKQEGVIVGTNYERIGGRLSVGSDPKAWLKMGADMCISHHASTEVANLPHSSGPTVSTYRGVDDNVLVQTLLQQPSDSPYNLDGSYAGPAKESGVSVNPVAEVKNSPLEYKETDVLGRAFMNVRLFNEVTWFTEFFADITRSDERLFLPPYDYGTLSRPAEMASLREGQYNSNLKDLIKGVSYDRLFSKSHKVGTYISLRSESFDWDGQMVEGKGFSTGALPAMNLASEAHGNRCFDGKASLFSLYGRALYDYRAKYGLKIDGSFDRSSFFNAETQWRFYPSVVANWIVSRENFWEYGDFLKPVTHLGLSARYSESGNSHYSQLVYMSNCYGNNLDLEWERNRLYSLLLKINFGKRDVYYIDDYVRLSARIFRRENTNLILDANAAGSENGLAKKDACFINAGSVKNTGFDVSLNSDIIRDSLLKKPISWSAALSFMHVRNEVTDLGPFNAVTEKSAPLGGYSLFGNDVTVNRTVVGRAPGQFYGYKYEGLIQNEAELADYRAKSGRTARVGDAKYSATKTYIGDPNPDFTFSFGTGLQWGQWSFNVLFTGAYGSDVYNMVRQRISEQSAANRNCNLSADCVNYARLAYDDAGNAYVANASTSMPRPDYDDASNAAASVISERYVEDGSYLKIQTVSLTYSLPSKMKCLWHLADFRLTASVENLHTFTKYSGYDPENPGSAIRQGVDEGRYPSPRTYRFSVSVKF